MTVDYVIMYNRTSVAYNVGIHVYQTESKINFLSTSRQKLTEFPEN